ncbi:GerMN domain-containing protein [Kribbella sp. CA-293567]|uniref:GerMN domain-containing protein n=1 Tax=Kribbella sp. CA-293567 TaxID=3002436 RepID=UPI0022DD7D0C|nr:GerMN domain-containing protein [Kribbella sp. CA-293567]WBQ03390.1 GerMN domain-containing protein [Kribbella sp. CA-293567]
MRKAALAVAAALVLAGCGVPVQDDPVEVRPEIVPSQLRPEATARPGPPTTVDPSSPKTLVQFVRADRLVGSVRDVRAGSLEDRLGAVLSALIAGPTDDEQTKGISTALPAELQIRVLSLEPPRVTLELSGDTDGKSAAENVLVVGQIVLSVTALSPVSEVRLARDGLPVEALLADGALTAEPLRAVDYAALR